MTHHTWLMYLAGMVGGWAVRGLWINYRHLRKELRLADDAVLEQDIASAQRHLARAKVMLEVL